MIRNLPKKFKLVFYKMFVDDNFVLLKKTEYKNCFVDYMNAKHKNINVF